MAVQLYYSIILATDPTPSADAIISGYGVSSGNIADPGAVQEYTFSSAAPGLTTGIIYSIVYVLADGPLRSQVTRSDPFVGTSAWIVLSGVTLTSLGGTSGTPQVTITYP